MSVSRTVPCTVVKAISGDTLELALRLGWGIVLTAPCRLLGVMASDPATAEGRRQHADLARAVESVAAEGASMAFTSYEVGKDGRAVGQMLITDAQGGRHDLAAVLTAD